jgi:hypothetical protein
MAILPNNIEMFSMDGIGLISPILAPLPSSIEKIDWAKLGNRPFQAHNSSFGSQSTQSSAGSLPTSPSLIPLNQVQNSPPSVSIPPMKGKENVKKLYRSMFCAETVSKPAQMGELPKSNRLFFGSEFVNGKPPKLEPKQPPSLGLATVSFATDSYVQEEMALEAKGAALKLSCCAKRALVRGAYFNMRDSLKKRVTNPSRKVCTEPPKIAPPQVISATNARNVIIGFKPQKTHVGGGGNGT